MISGARVLIVEDESIEALDLQQRLTAFGYNTPDIVATGVEAIQKAGETHPDLVLMDIMLPGEIDGVTAAERIRVLFGIPVIYITAYADEGTLLRARATEPYGYIMKPFRERELHITIDMALYKHKTQRELKEHREWLATTLRSIGDAVITTDMDGLITFMNPVAECLLGWKLEEASGKQLMDVFNIIDKETRRPVENLVERVLRQNLNIDLAGQTLLITRHGNEIPVDDSAAPIKDDQENTTGVVLAFRDATERWRAESALRQSYEELESRVRERAEELGKCTMELEAKNEDVRVITQQLWQVARMATIGELAASLAHELNNPLTTVSLRVESLAAQLSPDDPRQRSLQVIALEVERMSALVRSLLDFSRRRARRVSPVDLCREIEYALELAQYLLRKNRISVRRDYQPGLPLLHADCQEMQQLFLNLFTNAGDAMPQGGTLTVRIYTEHMEGDNYIAVDTADTGVGIPPGDLPRVMDPFFTTKPEGKGTGLGLPICRRIVQEHGGSITITSEAGTGTTVSLKLPVACEERGGK